MTAVFFSHIMIYFDKEVIMKNKKILIVVSLLVFITIAAFAASADTIVYITKTGTMYHSANCSTLRQSKIQITLGAAIKKGLTRCSRCNPPVLDDNTTKADFSDITQD